MRKVYLIISCLMFIALALKKHCFNVILQHCQLNVLFKSQMLEFFARQMLPREPIVLMVKLDLSMGVIFLKVVWKCALIMLGGHCVIQPSIKM